MEVLYLGTVKNFKKQRGFGFIEPDNKSMFGEKVYCHWKTIKTSDKWPTLPIGMRVAFQAEQDDGKDASWKTTEIYTEDGDEIGAAKEVALLNNGKKYKGSCKSYNKSRGTGFIKPDGNGPWPKTGVKVLRSDITTDAGSPILRKGLRLQFQVSKSDSGFKAVNVTLPGGRNVPTESPKLIVESTKVSTSKENGEKTQKKTRKRKLLLSKSTKNSPAKKRSTSVVSKKPVVSFKHSQIPSGVYGGMEVDEEDVIEVGIILRSHWVGSVIGKNGATINEIRKYSKADMKFGDNEIELDGGVFKVFALSGTMNQVSDACKLIAEKLGDAAQTLEYKIVFLVPNLYCGMFVGKKGSTINEIRGDQEQRVRVNLSQDPIQLPGSSAVTLCSVFGPRENVKDAIERTVAVLGAISTRLKKQMMEAKQWGEGNWNGGYGGGRESAGWSGRSQRGGRW